MLRQLADVHQLDPPGPPDDAGRELHGAEIGPALGQHLRRRPLGPAPQDLDVQAPLPVEALFIGHIVPGELGLRLPLGNKRNGVEFVGASQGDGDGKRAQEKPDQDQVARLSGN